MDFVTNSTCSWTNRHDLMIYLLSCFMLFSVFSVFTGEIVFFSLFCGRGTQDSWSVPRENTGHNGIHKDAANHHRAEPGSQVLTCKMLLDHTITLPELHRMAHFIF